MLDVMIIDDDFPIRSYLREVIRWEELGLNLVCEAENSETARELFHQYHPRIIITDIVIPIISGLELARELLQYDSNLYFIVITGYNDFEHTRDSVTLGAVDLLAKPIVPEEINASLEKAVHLFEERQQRFRTEQALQDMIRDNLPTLQSQCISQLMERAPVSSGKQLSAQLHLLDLSFPEQYFTVIQINLEQDRADNFNGAAFPIAFRKLCEDKFLSAGFRFFSFFATGNRLNCLAAWSFEHGDEQVETILEELLTETDFYFRTTFCAGIGGVVSSLELLYTSAEQASLALQFHDFDCPNIVNYRNMDKLTAPRTLCSEQTLRLLMDHIHAFRLDEFTSALDSWLQTAEACRSPEYRQEFALEFLAGMATSCYAIGVYPWREINYPQTVAAVMGASEKEQIRHALLTAADQFIMLLFHRRAKSKNQLIHLAKLYVQENIGDANLSVESVSSHIGLSKNYFSQLFHREEQISFNAYLNITRIEQAQNLLRNTSKKVFEISDLCGFSNPKYFNYVFKRAVGKTPLDWRKSIQEMP